MPFKIRYPDVPPCTFRAIFSFPFRSHAHTGIRPSPRSTPHRGSLRPPSPPETLLLLAAGQLVRKPTQLLRCVGDAAQRTLVLEPLPVALLLGLPGLFLGSPGLLPLPGFGLGLRLPLFGTSLGPFRPVAGNAPP